jgi:hypothetical protein
VKIRVTKYGHAFMISVCGMYMCMYPWLWSSFIGGLLIGWGLRLAKEYGEENGRYED